jgi:catechol-2,3-dioxygenase
MKILEIQLLTNKLEAQKDFYTNLLGLPLISQSANSFTIKAGWSNITFKQDKSAEHPYYHFAFNIPEDKIVESIKWLKRKADVLEYENSPLVNFRNWNAESAYFFDLGGNILEFIARHNLKNSAEGDFNSEMILYVSEIGMPVSSTIEFNKVLKEKTGINLWWAVDEKAFSAAGDEQGLLIVVPATRNWFPTNKPSKIFPLTVKLSGSTNGFFTFENSAYKIIIE